MFQQLNHGNILDIYGRDYTLDFSLTSKQLDLRFGYVDTLGICDPDERKIYVAIDAPQDQKPWVILHEIFEAIKFIFNWEKKLSEDDIIMLEKAMGYTLVKSGIELWKIGS